MHLRYQRRDRRDPLDLDDRPERQRLERQILEHRLDVDYQIQHPLDVERHLDEGHRLDVVRRPGLGARQQRRLDVGRGPCPG